MGKKNQVSTNSEMGEDTVMVTGGSGFIGRQFVPFLAESGHSVVSMYHMRLPDPFPKVFPVCSDLGSTELLAAPLRGVKTVVYLSWQSNFMASADEIRFEPNNSRSSPNVKLLNNLLRAMEKAGTERIIFVSAVGANRRARSTFLKEKYLGEVAVLNSKVPEKIIVRSNIVFSANTASDQFIRSIMNVMKFPGFYPVPKVDNKVAPVHISDFNMILKDLVEYEMSDSSAIVEVSGSEELKVEDVFRIISDKYASGSRFQLRGSLGDSLVPIFERRGEFYTALGPKIRDFLAIGNLKDFNTETDNPLLNLLPKNKKGFKEALKS